MAEAHANLGMLYYLQERYAEARPALEAALKLKPSLPGPYFFLGVIAFKGREFQKALGGWSFPSANCVFGDKQGNIGFKTILALPVRSAQSLLDDRAAHEGWDSANDWQGILPDELPASF